MCSNTPGGEGGGALRVDENTISIGVEDDGRGLGHERSPPGHGLANMQARARRVGARLEIGGANPGVRVALELNRADAATADRTFGQASARSEGFDEGADVPALAGEDLARRG